MRTSNQFISSAFLGTFYFFSSLFFGHNVSAQTFQIGKLSVAESRVKIDYNDFLINNPFSFIQASFENGSVQWLRNENNLLTPRALLVLKILRSEAQFHLEYQNRTILLSKYKNYYATKFYIDLFNPEEISLFAGANLEGKIKIEAKATADAKSKQLIDYSCSPYDVSIEGIDTEYISVGCRMSRLGSFGNEKPRLEVTLSSTNLRTYNNAKPPYTVFFHDNSPLEMVMKGSGDKSKILTLKAKLPERLHRLKLAYGFGPYIYDSTEDDLTEKSKVAPSLMLYGKLDLTETSSIKFFDALLYSKSYFNNAGLYYSYDLAEILDGRILVNTLLGFQELNYKFSSDTTNHFRLIYPQGFELIYRHAFKENYHFTYGMFLSTTAETYVNAWIRYGKGSFLELNYINWGYGKSQISMWGLSIGLPLASFF